MSSLGQVTKEQQNGGERRIIRTLIVLFLAANDVKVLEIWSISGFQADIVARESAFSSSKVHVYDNYSRSY